MDTYRYSILQDLTHATFLRDGGVSTGPYASLNLGLSTDDATENVQANRERAYAHLGLTSVATLKQVHGDTLHIADPNTRPEGDGLMTNTPGIALQVLHADCQAALFYDPVNRAIAAVHAGWRGNVLNIYQKTVHAMHNAYGTLPHNLRVAISPSLGPDASEFRNYKEEFPSTFHTFQTKPNYFDLWEIARWQLLSAGIQERHLEIARLCTYANVKRCFSYRREPVSGRHATLLTL